MGRIKQVVGWWVAISLAGCAHGVAGSAPGPAVAPAGREVLRPFDYRGVRLEGGMFGAQVAEVRESYLRVADDDLLKGFRRRAGLPAPGTELAGWYGRDQFHAFGQVVSGLARMYAATGDRAFKEKVDHLVAEWGKCIGPDGYFYYSRDPNSPHYTYEKMVCGLVDAHVYAGTPGALEYLSRITDWAERNLDRGRVYAQHAPGRSQEWYTLSENLYRAYLVTGEERYRAFARVWEYTDYWDLYRRGGDIFTRPGRFHAYSHVNTLSGAAMAYRVTGERGYLETIVHAYDYLRMHQEYATGGYGPGEQLVREGELLRSIEDEDRSFETECGAWAGFKLGKYLIEFTGDARYGDWVEALAVNGICASLPMAGDGRVTYYSQYALHGGAKGYSAMAWPCCAGTRIQAVADLTDLVFFRSDDDDDDALCVNLFAPARCEWERRDGVRVAVRQVTRFPEEEGTRLEVGVSAPAGRGVEFELKVRNPGWLARPMGVRVNGRAVAATVGGDHWVGVRRAWRDGDVVEVSLPMGLRAERLPASSAAAFPAAVAYGPTVLAFTSAGGPPGREVDFGHLVDALRPVAGRAATFALASDPRVVARPFYAVGKGEPYYLYLDPAYGWATVDPARWTESGAWHDGGGARVSVEPGAFVEAEFEGTGVRWVGRRFDDAGRAEVSVDGKVAGVVDQYAPVRGVPFRYEVKGLAPGRHTVRVRVLKEHAPESKNRFVNVIRFEATNTGNPASAAQTAR